MSNDDSKRLIHEYKDRMNELGWKPWMDLMAFELKKKVGRVSSAFLYANQPKPGEWQLTVIVKPTGPGTEYSGENFTFSDPFVAHTWLHLEF